MNLSPRQLVLMIVVTASTVVRFDFARAEHADETPERLPQSFVSVNDAQDVRLFRLPKSHVGSIYFLPGSDRLDDSARAAINDIAARLRGDVNLHVALIAYADEVSDGGDSLSLQKSRADAVASALAGEGIDLGRISKSSKLDDYETTMPCSSEYCRQSYRRVAIFISRSARN